MTSLLLDVRLETKSQYVCDDNFAASAATVCKPVVYVAGVGRVRQNIMVLHAYSWLAINMNTCVNGMNCRLQHTWGLCMGGNWSRE